MKLRVAIYCYSLFFAINWLIIQKEGFRWEIRQIFLVIFIEVLLCEYYSKEVGFFL